MPSFKCGQRSTPSFRHAFFSVDAAMPRVFAACFIDIPSISCRRAAVSSKTSGPTSHPGLFLRGTSFRVGTGAATCCCCCCCSGARLLRLVEKLGVGSETAEEKECPATSVANSVANESVAGPALPGTCTTESETGVWNSVYAVGVGVLHIAYAVGREEDAVGTSEEETPGNKGLVVAAKVALFKVVNGSRKSISLDAGTRASTGCDGTEAEEESKSSEHEDSGDSSASAHFGENATRNFEIVLLEPSNGVTFTSHWSSWHSLVYI
mmetsp:Transcript_58810/g.120312  ORF Transcript_58810/g.120312 Transcript_58810/m.120312 type:complete len:266 (-) Transcript_58810:754-1551(-)